MRIPAEALRAIRTELVQSHQCGVTGQLFEPTSALNSLLVELDYHGVEIVPKAAAKPNVVRTTTTVKDGVTTLKVHLPEGNPAAIRHQLYLNAVSLLRGPAVPLAEVVAMALGDASPDGCQGNVWKLFDLRLRARGHAIVSDKVDAPFDPSTLAPLTCEDFTGKLEPGTDAAPTQGTRLHMGHTRGIEVCVPYQKAVPLTVTIGDETLQAFANIDDVEALRRALPRLTTPTEDAL